MMSILDKSVGQVIDALFKKGVLNETILLFLSDNGGPTVGQHATRASNYPLRGQKNSPWEGGVRSSAALWTSQLLHPGSVWTQKMYIADLLPTLANAVGIDLDSKQLDGLNMWQAILKADENSIFEREIVHNIDDIFNYESYVLGKFKFINGTTVNGSSDEWFGRRPAVNSNETDPRANRYENIIKDTSVWQQLQELNMASSPYFLYSEVNITHLRVAAEVQCPSKIDKRDCKPLQSPCLFDIDADPCEMNNLYEEQTHAKILETILQRVAKHRKTVHTPNNKPEDPRCDPRFYSNEWTWWEDIEDQKNTGRKLTTAVQLCNWIFLFVLLQLGIAALC